MPKKTSGPWKDLLRDVGVYLDIPVSLKSSYGHFRGRCSHAAHSKVTFQDLCHHHVLRGAGKEARRDQRTLVVVL